MQRVTLFICIVPFLLLSLCERSSSPVVIPNPCFSLLRNLSNLSKPVVDIVSVFLSQDNLMSREEIARNEHPAVVDAVATRWVLQRVVVEEHTLFIHIETAKSNLLRLSSSRMKSTR
jgi:hypothetical protein